MGRSTEVGKRGTGRRVGEQCHLPASHKGPTAHPYLLTWKMVQPSLAY